MQCYSCKEFGHIAPIVVRNSAIIVNIMDTLSSNVLHAQKTDKAKLFRLLF